VGAEYDADLETREGEGEPWQLLKRVGLARGHQLDQLVFPSGFKAPTLEEDGFTDFPPLGVILGMPDDFHALVEMRRRLDALPSDVKGNPFSLSQAEWDLRDEVLGPFSYESVSVGWITLERLERYPWDTSFTSRRSHARDPRIETVTVRAEVLPRLNGAIDLLRSAGKGSNARLVVCRY
jgi:hypothetical protein